MRCSILTAHAAPTCSANQANHSDITPSPVTVATDPVALVQQRDHGSRIAAGLGAVKEGGRRPQRAGWRGMERSD